MREAEQLGFESIWVPEPYSTDAGTLLGSYAAVTDRILLGTTVLAMPGRTPAMTAQTAMTVDFMSSGRMILGLGTSGPQVAEGWHGVSFDRPVQRTREYIDVVRMALRREVLVYEGETITLPRPGSEGKPLKLISRPVREAIPIYLAALGPRNLALCGEIADGWLPLWFAPEHATRIMKPLLEGAARAGRTLDDISVSPNVLFRIEDNVDDARSIMRVPLALYIGGMGSRRNNFYKNLIGSYGYAEVCEQIQGLYLDGRKADAAAAIPDELIDLVTLCGPVERIAERLEAYRGVCDRIVALPTAVFESDRSEQLRLFANAAGLSR